MGKRGFIITIFFILVLSILNIYIYFNKKNMFYLGMFVKEIKALPLGVNLSLLAFIIGWIILVLIIIITLLKFLRYQKDDSSKEIIYSKVKQEFSKSRTSLDDLYDLLKKTKRLGISSIARIFKINSEQALSWAKILENYELATIEYPAFSEPQILLKEDKIEQEKMEKNNEKIKKIKREKVMVKEKGLKDFFQKDNQ